MVAIRQLWSFRHLVGLAGWSTDTTLWTKYGYPFSPFYNGYATGGITASGNMGLKLLGSGNGGNISFFYKDVVPKWGTDADVRIIMGFRFQETNAPGSAMATNTVAALTGIAAPLAPSRFGGVINKEYWIEIEIDKLAKTAKFYVDGTLVNSVSGATFAATDGITLAYQSGYVANVVFEYNDFYVIEDTRDATPCARLGALRSVPLTSVTATGADWTTTDSSALKSVVNTGLSAVPPALPAATPAAVAGASHAPLILVPQFPAGYADTRPVLALQSNLTYTAPDLVPGGMQTTLRKNTDSSAVQSLTAVAKAFSVNKSAMIVTATPAGQGLTKAEIEACQIYMTPVEG